MATSDILSGAVGTSLKEKSTAGSNPSWAQVVANNRRREAGLALNFVPQQYSDTAIILEDSKWENGLKDWENCLVRFVYGLKPHLPRIQSYICNRWGSKDVT
eukprot:TRINITY_DN5240_c0_g1_i5.p1 TRINITY_DN5240_c0_g1~~TRINITY_DN5240_c0_g1_i5.p1  ORF type:complete len:102 (+),score=18.13 TRINITY_DN5240_c0_g1_i5:18-323(+)